MRFSVLRIPFAYQKVRYSMVALCRLRVPEQWSIPTPFKSSTDLREPIAYEPLTGRRGSLANPEILHGLETGPISHGKGCVRGGPTGSLENSKCDFQEPSQRTFGWLAPKPSSQKTKKNQNSSKTLLDGYDLNDWNSTF